jgi:hypothetical protein
MGVVFGNKWLELVPMGERQRIFRFSGTRRSGGHSSMVDEMYLGVSMRRLIGESGDTLEFEPLREGKRHLYRTLRPAEVI